MEDNFRHNTRLWRMRKGLSQRAIRKAHNQSVAEFAEQVGISISAYKSYFHGTIISLHCFWIMVDHLDIDPWLLATGKTHKEG